MPNKEVLAVGLSTPHCFSSLTDYDIFDQSDRFKVEKQAWRATCSNGGSDGRECHRCSYERFQSIVRCNIDRSSAPNLRHQYFRTGYRFVDHLIVYQEWDDALRLASEFHDSCLAELDRGSNGDDDDRHIKYAAFKSKRLLGVAWRHARNSSPKDAIAYLDDALLFLSQQGELWVPTDDDFQFVTLRTHPWYAKLQCTVHGDIIRCWWRHFIQKGMQLGEMTRTESTQLDRLKGDFFESYLATNQNSLLTPIMHDNKARILLLTGTDPKNVLVNLRNDVAAFNGICFNTERLSIKETVAVCEYFIEKFDDEARAIQQSARTARAARETAERLHLANARCNLQDVLYYLNKST